MWTSAVGAESQAGRASAAVEQLTCLTCTQHAHVARTHSPTHLHTLTHMPICTSPLSLFLTAISSNSSHSRTYLLSSTLTHAFTRTYTQTQTHRTQTHTHTPSLCVSVSRKNDGKSICPSSLPIVSLSTALGSLLFSMKSPVMSCFLSFVFKVAKKVQ